jgi:hypothetical protein
MKKTLIFFNIFLLVSTAQAQETMPTLNFKYTSPEKFPEEIEIFQNKLSIYQLNSKKNCESLPKVQVKDCLQTLKVNYDNSVQEMIKARINFLQYLHKKRIDQLKSLIVRPN